MSAQNTDPTVRTPGRRALIGAWISVAAIPVGFILGMVLGNALASMIGVDPEGGSPAWMLLVVGIPSVALMLVPSIVATVFGLRARKLGEGSGIAPVIIGVVAAAWAVLTNTLPLLISG